MDTFCAIDALHFMSYLKIPWIDGKNIFAKREIILKKIVCASFCILPNTCSSRIYLTHLGRKIIYKGLFRKLRFKSDVALLLKMLAAIMGLKINVEEQVMTTASDIEQSKVNESYFWKFLSEKTCGFICECYRGENKQERSKGLDFLLAWTQRKIMRI